MSTTQDTAALAATSGLSEPDVRFWLPRLPAGLDDVAIAGKLRQIAAIREPEPAAATLAGLMDTSRSRAGVPWSAERRARFEAKRRRQKGMGG